MTITLIYLGKSGGGSKFASAVFEALGKNNTSLIVSERNEEIWQSEVKKIQKIPTGIIENLSILLNPMRRNRLINLIMNNIEGNEVIFLMPHPLDNAIRRKIKNKMIYTVIHDAKPHQGEIWPSRLTIQKLLRNSDRKIFLSQKVAMEISNKYKKNSIILPLIMSTPKLNRHRVQNYEIAFLGRHKKYKNYEFQVKLINRISSKYKVFASLPKKYASQLDKSEKLTVETNWLSNQTYNLILSTSKCLLLTHSESSQSGLIIEAAGLGLQVLAPNIASIRQQLEEFNTGYLYNPNDLDDAEKKVKLALLHYSKKRPSTNEIKKNSEIWFQTFNKLETHEKVNAN